MKNNIFSSLLLAGGVLASSSTLAAPVLIKETGLGNGLATGGLILPISSSAQNYWSGLQTLLIDNTRSVLAFCVDPWEWSSSSNQSYVENSLVTIFGAPKAGLIRELYSESYGSTLLSGNIGNLNAAGFQLALWEIIADDNVLLGGLQSDLANGLVRKTGNTNASIVTAAQAMLSRIDGNYGSDNFSFELFTSGKSLGQGRVTGYQDFLVVTKVPEPGMLGLLAGALGSLGLVSLRRRKAISAS